MLMTSKIYDPFFDTQRCIDRLYGWYQQHKTLICAFDWDDTLFDFHGKGYAYPDVADLLFECQELGFTLVLFTTKETQTELDEVVHQLLVDYALHIKYVNDSPVMAGAKKPYYNVLLDDKAGLGQAYEILRTVVGKVKESRNESN